MSRWRDLAERVEKAWRAVDYEEQQFPALAMELLAAERVHETVTLDDIYNHVFDGGVWPVPQNAGTFGQPPVPLFTTPRFYIEALLWLHGSISIHEHSFSGAFALMAGESIHTEYDWTPTDRINARMVFGDLKLKKPSQILRPGDCLPIPAGQEFIHAVYHRVAPTVTIIVRTTEQAEAGIQYVYTQAGLAFDPYFQDARFDTLRKTLRFVKTIDEEAFVHRLFDVISKAPLFDIVRLMHEWAPFLSEHELMGYALSGVAERHSPDRARGLAMMLQESLYSARVRAALSQTEDPVLRLIMQAGLTCTSTDDAVGVVGQVQPDAVDLARNWLQVNRPPYW